MTKQQASTCGKRLFILGLIVFAIGSPFGWLIIWLNVRPFEAQLFTVAGIGFAIILIAFCFLAYGSRIGDNQD